MAGRAMIYPPLGIVYARMEQDKIERAEKEKQEKLQKEQAQKGVSAASPKGYGATSEKVAKAVSREMVRITEVEHKEDKTDESRTDSLKRPLLEESSLLEKDYVELARDAYDRALELLGKEEVVSAYTKFCHAFYLQKKAEERGDTDFYIQGGSVMDSDLYDKSIQALVKTTPSLISIPRPTFKD